MPITRKIWDLFFGCRHKDLSRPFSSEGQTYKVCLKCGAHLPYSWETMTVTPERATGKKLAKGSR